MLTRSLRTPYPLPTDAPPRRRITEVEAAVMVSAVGGLADLVAVRKTLAMLLNWDREQQDREIEAARRSGRVTGTAREGRNGVTAEQRATETADGCGYLSIREEGA
jgi:hypothetical protein